MDEKKHGVYRITLESTYHGVTTYPPGWRIWIDNENYGFETDEAEAHARFKRIIDGKNKENIHPEDYCDRCDHRMRFNYAADNEVWNQIIGEKWSIICIDCFIELCQDADVEPKFVVFHIPGSEFYFSLTPALINPDSEFDCIFCKTRFKISDGHQCEEKETS